MKPKGEKHEEFIEANETPFLTQFVKCQLLYSRLRGLRGGVKMGVIGGIVVKKNKLIFFFHLPIPHSP